MLRPLKRILALAATALCLTQVAVAQSVPLDEWLETTLGQALRESAPDNAKSDALDRYPYRFVFLVNTAQASNKTTYIAYARQGIERFLGKRWAAATARPEADRPTFQIIPYQLDVYPGSEETALSPSYNKIFQDFPLVARQKRADGSPYKTGDGSLNLVALEAAVKDAQKTTDRPTVIVQVTPNPVSEWRGHPGIADGEAEQRKQLLKDADFLEYPSPGQPLITDPPEKGKEGYKVHAWLVGPRSLETYRQLDPIAAAGMSPLIIGLIVVGALVIVAIAYKLLFANGGSPATLQKGVSAGAAYKGPSIKLGDCADYTPGPTEVVKVYGRSPESGGLLLTGVPGADEEEGVLFQFRRVKSGIEIAGVIWKVHSSHGSANPVLTSKDQVVNFTASDGLGRQVPVQIRGLK